MRRRGVPTWEIAAGSGIRAATAPPNAHFGPDHLSNATRVIGAYFADIMGSNGGLRVCN